MTDDFDPHETDVTFAEWSGLFPEIVETDRLRLERLSRDRIDLHAFYEVCAHDPDIEEVTEHLTWGPHPHPKSTFEFVTAMEDAWDEAENATYLVRPHGADTFSGGAGLGVDWEKRTGILGVWLRKRFWGRGYSGERAAALIALVFERLDLELVAVDHMVGNEQSRRAIEKYVEHFGGRHEGLFRNRGLKDGEPVDHHRYSISREEYRENRPEDVTVADRE